MKKIILSTLVMAVSALNAFAANELPALSDVKVVVKAATSHTEEPTVFVNFKYASCGPRVFTSEAVNAPFSDLVLIKIDQTFNFDCPGPRIERKYSLQLEVTGHTMNTGYELANPLPVIIKKSAPTFPLPTPKVDDKEIYDAFTILAVRQETEEAGYKLVKAAHGLTCEKTKMAQAEAQVEETTACKIDALSLEAKEVYSLLEVEEVNPTPGRLGVTTLLKKVGRLTCSKTSIVTYPAPEATYFCAMMN